MAKNQNPESPEERTEQPKKKKSIKKIIIIISAIVVACLVFLYIVGASTPEEVRQQRAEQARQQQEQKAQQEAEEEQKKAEQAQKEKEQAEQEAEQARKEKEQAEQEAQQAKTNKDALQRAIEQATALNEADYEIDEVYGDLMFAVDRGRIVLNNPDATQAEIDETADNIQTLISHLTPAFQRGEYRSIPYKELRANLNNYLGEKLVVSGGITNIPDSTTVNIATDRGDFAVVRFFPVRGLHLDKHDQIVVYGRFLGLEEVELGIGGVPPVGEYISANAIEADGDFYIISP